MGCLCNNLDDLLKTCSCGCNVCTTTTVPTTTTTTCIGEPCDEIIDPNCIIYNGPEIPCWGIQTGDSAADILDIIIGLLCPDTTTTTTSPVPQELLPLTLKYSNVSLGDACGQTTTATYYAYTTCHNYIVTNNAFNVLGCIIYEDAAGIQPALNGFYITPTTLCLIVGNYNNGIISGVTVCP